MNWQEVLALVYLITLAIVIWFITIRKLVIETRKKIRERIPSEIARYTNGDNSSNKPEPDRVSHPEIVELDHRPDQECYANNGKGKPPPIHNKAL